MYLNSMELIKLLVINSSQRKTNLLLIKSRKISIKQESLEKKLIDVASKCFDLLRS